MAALPPATVSFQPTGTSKPKSGDMIISSPSGFAVVMAGACVAAGAAVGTAVAEDGAEVVG